MELSDDQKEVFLKYKQKENVFMTGPGGSGKSALIKYIVNDAKEQGLKVQVCALTGCAAVLLQCQAKTIHSWAGIGLGNGDISIIAKKVSDNKYKRKNWKSVDLLIIDEVSMMSLKLFELLDLTGKYCKKTALSFGGIQVIFSGDFFQLPPVPTQGEPETSQFCFESELWEQTFPNQLKLTSIFRQKDNKYIKVLNQIRVGRITKSTCNLLNNYIGRKINIEDKILPTILYPTKRKVDQINQSSMMKLESKEQVFMADYCQQNDLNLTKKQETLDSAFSQVQKEYEKRYLMDNINFDKSLVLKKGAQVMCIANLDLESDKPICNGSRGVIKDFDEKGVPIVEFKNGVVRRVGCHSWQSEMIPSIGVKQVPLILAWAITIHKSQGASLDLAEIDIGNGIFECGQTYVALSRITDLNGLYLNSFNPAKIMINKKVIDYYSRI